MGSDASAFSRLLCQGPGTRGKFLPHPRVHQGRGEAGFWQLLAGGYAADPTQAGPALHADKTNLPLGRRGDLSLPHLATPNLLKGRETERVRPVTWPAMSKARRHTLPALIATRNCPMAVWTWKRWIPPSSPSRAGTTFITSSLAESTCRCVIPRRGGNFS